MSGTASQKTILLFESSPINLTHLRLDEEERTIDEALRHASQRDRFDLKLRHAARTRDLQISMLETKPSIVHFCGHGTGEEGLVFQDEAGRAKLVSTVALASLFELFDQSVECVVLNACFAEVQANAISKHIRYVIGTHKAIGDQAAIEFSRGFYQALGAGESIERAFKFGCNAIQIERIPEHLTPVLKINSEINSPPPPPPPPNGNGRKPTKIELVEALLDCSMMSDRGSRDAIVEQLPIEIRGSIKRSNLDKIDITNIVSRCLDFEGGIQQLSETLHSFEGETPAMRKIQELVSAFDYAPL